MSDFEELLDVAVGQTTFDLGRRQTVDGRVQTSFASRQEEVISSEHFRDLSRRPSWQDEEIERATSARVVVPMTCWLD